nr:MAG TPA: Structural protein [Crassvirales sp.]
MKYKDIVYMVLDEIKSTSDDAFFTEEHVLLLVNNYRNFILKQRYSDIKKPIPESNYQTICLNLIQVPAIAGVPCGGGTFLRSKEKVPFMMKIGTPKVYPINYYLGEITYVSRERMRYVGYNKYLQNIIYASLGPDNYLYLQSSNPQYLYLEKIRLTGIFENIESVLDLLCDDSGDSINCDIMDKTFPIEDALVPPIIELVVKELLGAEYRPKDESNDAKDELSEVASK